MHIWLVRHAVAADREEFTGDDAERPLTEKGRRRFRNFSRWLSCEADAPELIVTSPLFRARETAEILRKELGLKKNDLTVSDTLSPGADPRHMLGLAREFGGARLALVGHEPDFSQALSRFVGGGAFAFGKGWIASVSFPGELELDAGRLTWFVGPQFGEK